MKLLRWIGHEIFNLKFITIKYYTANILFRSPAPECHHFSTILAAHKKLNSNINQRE